MFIFVAYQTYISSRQDIDSTKYKEEKALLDYSNQNFDKVLDEYIDKSPI